MEIVDKQEMQLLKLRLLQRRVPHSASGIPELLLSTIVPELRNLLPSRGPVENKLHFRDKTVTFATEALLTIAESKPRAHRRKTNDFLRQQPQP